MKGKFYGNGKLLLTGEYAVLDGAKALAIPLKYGQSLSINNTRGCDIVWEAYDNNDEKWFNSRINIFDFKPLKTTDPDISDRLTKIFDTACKFNSDFMSTWKGMKVRTKLDFPLHYGWGSSSTLIYCIAQWAGVDPYELYKVTFGGSGYDIACASSQKPIFYRLLNESPQIEEVDWLPNYIDHIYIVYQGDKQNSRAAIQHYNSKGKSEKLMNDITHLSDEFYNSKSLEDLQRVIIEHESIMSSLLGIKPVKSRIFSDFNGEVKSLGAWGGDFALLTTEMDRNDVETYCEEKSLNHLIPLKEIMFQM